MTIRERKADLRNKLADCDSLSMAEAQRLVAAIEAAHCHMTLNTIEAQIDARRIIEFAQQELRWR